MPRLTLGSFSIEAGEGWTLSTVILAGPVPEVPRARGALAGRSVRTFQRNVVMTMERVDDEVTPQAYFERQAEGLRQAGVARQLVAPQTVVALSGGAQGEVSEQIVAGPEGERVRQMILMARKGGVMYTLIASNLDGPLFEDARADFKAILTSFV